MNYVRPIGLYHEIGSFDVKFGGTQTLLLNRENEVQLYKLRLEITHTNAATVSLTVTDLHRLITELRITAGGRNNIKMVGALKFYLNYLKNYGITPKYSIDTTVSTAGLKSYVIIEVPMNMFDMKRPYDSIFPTYKFQNLELKVTFGSATSIGTGVTITSGTITVFEDGIENYARQEGYGFFKEIYSSNKISSNNPKYELKLPTELLYKQFTFASIVDDALSDGIINGVTIRSGSKIIKQYSLYEIKEQMRRRFGQASEALMTGFLIIDFGERGHGTEFVDTRQNEGGFLQLSAELDVTAVGTDNQVIMYTDYYEELPLAPKA